MKQGRATHSGMGSTKTEPRAQAVHPGGAGNLGISQGNHATDKGDMPFKTTSLFGGAVLKPPMAGSQTHPCGSQGKHK